MNCFGSCAKRRDTGFLWDKQNLQDCTRSKAEPVPTTLQRGRRCSGKGKFDVGLNITRKHSARYRDSSNALPPPPNPARWLSRAERPPCSTRVAARHQARAAGSCGRNSATLFCRALPGYAPCPPVSNTSTGKDGGEDGTWSN